MDICIYSLLSVASHRPKWKANCHPWSSSQISPWTWSAWPQELSLWFVSPSTCQVLWKGLIREIYKDRNLPDRTKGPDTSCHTVCTSTSGWILCHAVPRCSGCCAYWWGWHSVWCPGGVLAPGRWSSVLSHTIRTSLLLWSTTIPLSAQPRVALSRNLHPATFTLHKCNSYSLKLA